jgi:hypothetical protein
MVRTSLLLGRPYEVPFKGFGYFRVGGGGDGGGFEGIGFPDGIVFPFSSLGRFGFCSAISKTFL